MEDHSTTNPSLHALYVGWAMQHLDFLNSVIEEADNFHNFNMMGTVQALQTERRQLIEGNAAYRDAAARLMAGDEPPINENDLAERVNEGADALVKLRNGGVIIFNSANTERFTSMTDKLSTLFDPPSSYGTYDGSRAASPTGRNPSGPEPQDLPRTDPLDTLVDNLRRRVEEPVDEARTPTHYVLRKSGGALFVKEAKFFISQGGTSEPWGWGWTPVVADDLEGAKAAFLAMKPETDLELHDRLGTDAQLWARVFIKNIKDPHFEVPNMWSEEYMNGWFANAIEAGRAAGLAEEAKKSDDMTKQRDIAIDEVHKLREKLKSYVDGISITASSPKLEQLETALRRFLTNPMEVAVKKAIREAALAYFEGRK